MQGGHWCGLGASGRPSHGPSCQLPAGCVVHPHRDPSPPLSCGEGRGHAAPALQGLALCLSEPRPSLPLPAWGHGDWTRSALLQVLHGCGQDLALGRTPSGRVNPAYTGSRVGWRYVPKYAEETLSPVSLEVIALDMRYRS